MNHPDWRMTTAQFVGQGYDHLKVYRALCDSLNEPKYTICGTCGQPEHDGPCDSCDAVGNPTETMNHILN